VSTFSPAVIERAESIAVTLRRDPPLVHDQGNSCFSLSLKTLQWLEDQLEPGMRTVETGCGSSTVVFARSGAQHTVVTPAEAEHERLRAYCEERDIDTSNVSFVAEPSHEALRTIAGDVDLALLDGAHGYPYPIIDWFLVAPLLKIGGKLLIDDAFIPAVRSLVDYLAGSDAWSEPALVDDRTVAFERLDLGLPAFDEWRGLGGRVSFSYLPLTRQPTAWMLFLLRANASKQPIKLLNELRHGEVAPRALRNGDRPLDRATLERRIRSAVDRIAVRSR
jgi:precorrin-6B methylase 2